MLQVTGPFLGLPSPVIPRAFLRNLRSVAILLTVRSVAGWPVSWAWAAITTALKTVW